MKNLLKFFMILTLVVGFVYADVTPISSIQDVTGADSDESPMVGETVTIQGRISAESWAYDNEYYFVQDAEAKWSGIMVYDADRGNTYGMEVKITGTVSEHYGMTQISDVTEFVVTDSNMVDVNPIEVTSGEIATDGENAEAYEGVLVKVVDADITNPDAGYGQWYIDDGSGEVMLDDEADYYFDPTKYETVKAVVGPLNYSYDDHKIIPRGAWDIVEGDDYVRIQRIQQVRHSALQRTVIDAISDTSYMVGDTMSVKGIVTMPTGLSYAGAGIKFIFQEEGGGPWSSILSYNEDSTAYPQLFEGDLIEMTGYIEEYSTGSANMTEFFITSPINIVNFGLETPPVDTVKTGDLREPVTAEQWGNNIVAVKDAIVKDVDPGYELFSIDDGSGEILVDDDSDSLVGYPDPPVGAVFETIEGWVYHHYGSYEQMDTYKLCPLYVEDLVFGGGPPSLDNVARYPLKPSSADQVNVSLDVTTNGVIDKVNLYYRVNNGSFIKMDMIDEDEDGNYTGTIYENADGAWVEYFIEAIDKEEQSSMMPADTSKKFYGYVVRDGEMQISDIQYSPWELADSPFDECPVEISGIVTVDTSFKNLYDAYMIQDGAGEWNGITVTNVDEILSRGDEIKVYGTVKEYWDDWHFKWDNNTLIVADSIEVLSTGNDVPAAVELTTGELAANSEAYEGTLVKVSDVQVTAANQYDWSVDDGSGPILIDDDASKMDEWFENLEVGDALEYVQGPFIFSFGTYKIELRDMSDVSEGNAVDQEIHTARTFKLEQNFPNPFNPETRIYFEIPQTEMVTIAIYNVLGKKVRTLESARLSAGCYTLNWDGKNDMGATVPTGAYFYRMKAGDFIATKKMLLMK